MLLAFSATPDELEVLMLSLTFGNVDVQKYAYLLGLFYWMACCPRLDPRGSASLGFFQSLSWDTFLLLVSCLRNIVTLFHYIEKERAWRKENGKPEGFETLRARKPIGRFEVVMEGRTAADAGYGSCGWRGGAAG